MTTSYIRKNIIHTVLPTLLSMTLIFNVTSAMYAGEKKPTGRSARFYIEDPYNLFYTGGGGANIFSDSTDQNVYEEILEQYPEGSYGIDDFMNFYIYQIDVQNQSNRTGLCLFSSYMMCIQYLTGTKYSTAELASLAKTYCASDGTCDGQALLSHFGISGDCNYNMEKSLNPTSVATALNSGKAIVGHVKNGYLGGKHYDGHFFVITGVDSTGYTIVDPGAKYSYAPQRHVSAAEIANWSVAGFREIG